MKGSIPARVLPVMIGLIGAAAAAAWVFRIDLGDWRPVRTTGERGAEAPAQGVEPPGPPPWSLRHELFSSDVQPLPGRWPSFRGPRRDAVSRENVPLADAWPAGGPPVLWRVRLGEGHSGAAVLNGRLYVMDYEPPDYLLLRASEITDWRALCGRLAAGGDRAAPSPERRVWELLPPPAREAVLRGAADELGPADRQVLLEALNDVVRDRAFYRADHFPDVRLSSYLRLSTKLDPIAGTRAIALDADEQKVLRINRTLIEQSFGGTVAERWKGDVVRCFALADGRELWRTAYSVRIKIEHGVSRTVPAVTEKHVVTFGPRCHAACFDAETGRPLWRRTYQTEAGQPEPQPRPYVDLVREYGAQVPSWNAAQCPLIDTDAAGREVALFAPGGEALFVAIDCATGKVVWQTPTPPGWTRTMTHSSISPMTLEGRKTYVYAFREGAVAVAAEDGAIVWSTTEWANSVIAPSPLPLPGDRVLFTAGYGGGTVMIQLARRDGEVAATRLWAKREAEFGSYQQTPIVHEGLVYAVIAKVGPHREELACMDLEGNVLWHSGGGYRFGWGPFILADGRMYLLSEEGVLTMARVSRGGFRPLARARVLQGGGKAWAPIALAGGRMIFRDETEMVCLDVSAVGAGAAP